MKLLQSNPERILALRLSALPPPSPRSHASFPSSLSFPLSVNKATLLRRDGGGLNTSHIISSSQLAEGALLLFVWLADNPIRRGPGRLGYGGERGHKYGDRRVDSPSSPLCDRPAARSPSQLVWSQPT